MTPVLPSSINNVSLIPEPAFITRKNICLTRSRLLGRPTKQTLSPQRFLLPLSTSVRLFPQYSSDCEFHRKSRNLILSATGTDVAVEETDAPVEDKNGGGDSELPSNAVEASEEPSIKSNADPSPVRTKRIRPAWKSEMPPVKNEELIPGATFTGKVKSIQPFGAFIDFGAFTDGLVHVSRLSDGFVKDVGNIVSIGQEVKVRLVEANTETGRISLTMRESDDIEKIQQQKDAPVSSDKSRPPRRNPKKDGMRKNTKLVKGQDLEGTVKNLARSGAFISLPEGEEGFLPASEETEDGFANIMGGSSLQIGQEVSVRVLRIARGQVTLTMKKEEANAVLDSQLNSGVIHVATNPFLLAFRKNKDIATFLDERETKEEAESPVLPSAEVAEKVKEVETTSDISDEQDKPTESNEDLVSAPSAEVNAVEDSAISAKEEDVGTSKVDDILNNDIDPESLVSTSSQSVDGERIVSTESMKLEGPLAKDVEEIAAESVSSEIVDQISSSENLSSNEVKENQEIPAEGTHISEEIVEDQVKYGIKDEEQIQTPAAEDEYLSATTVADENVGSVPEKNGSVTNSGGQTGIPSAEESVTKAAISPALVKQLREETGAGMMDCKNALSESEGDIVKAQEFLRKKGLASADKKASRATAEGRIGSYIHDSRIGVLIEVNCETDFVSRGDIFKELVDDLAMQVAACPQVQYLATEDVSEEIVNKEREIEMQKEDLLSKPEQIRSKIVDGRIRKRLEDLALLEQSYIKNDKVAVKDWVKQTIATIGENIKVKRFVRYNLGEGLEKKSQDFAAEVAAQTTAKPPSPGKDQPAAVEAKETVEKPPTVTVSAALVKQLRDETGAGMMDCKKALSETGGDLEKAQEYLRKKGLSSADKKSSRLAAEGRIGSYIHDARIGVLIEVNCETDFVGRSEKFKELVDDLAMQVVASPQVQYVSIEDIPESMVRKEKELEMQREDLLSKPENIRERIVEGRISKRLGELALLEQPFIKNDSLLVKDLVKQTVAAIGENIKVRRFVRFTLGEEIENAEEAENEA